MRPRRLMLIWTACVLVMGMLISPTRPLQAMGTVQTASSASNQWQLVKLPMQGDDVRDVSCPSRRDCYVLVSGGAKTSSPPNYVLASHDGGTSWVRTALAAPGNVSAIECSSPSVCVILGDTGTLLVTGNGGVTWSNRSLKMQSSGIDDQDFTGIACPTKQVCFLVDNWSVRRSDDGGMTWKVLALPSTLSGFINVGCSDARTCVVSGENGLVIRTTDGFRTWQSKNLGDLTFNGVACPSLQTCIVSGSSSASGSDGIYVTHDEGKTWGESVSGAGYAYLDLSCSDSSFCATPDTGSVAISTDSGDTWYSSTISQLGSDIRGISCPAVNACMVVAADGQAFVSSGWSGSSQSPMGQARKIAKTTPRGFVTIRDEQSGAQLHSLALAGIPGRVVVDSPTHHAFIAVASPDDGSSAVDVVDTQTGVLVRQDPLNGPIQDIALLSSVGRVFVVSGPVIRTIDAKTGRLDPEALLPCLSPRNLTTSEHDKRLYVACTQAIATVDATTGATISSAVLSGSAYMVVHENTGHLIVLSADPNSATIGSVTTLSLQSGKVISTHSISPVTRGHAASTAPEYVFTVIQNDVVMVDTTSGSTVRTIHVSIDPWALVENDALKRVYVLTGAYFDAEANPNEPGTASVIDSRTGKLVHTVALGKAAFWPGENPIAADTNANLVWILSTNNQRISGIAALNARTGALIRTIYPPTTASTHLLLPSALALDTRAEHVIETLAVVG
jgi:photosystem II stability/assembly factor-like uncharacterized protein